MRNRADTACKSSLTRPIVFPLSSLSPTLKRHDVLTQLSEDGQKQGSVCVVDAA